MFKFFYFPSLQCLWSLLVIAGPPENVVKLRTTTPLFRAYDHAYRLLETTYCPMFLQSDRVSM